MTPYVMEKGLTAFNAKTKQQKHNVLIFMDNVTCHPHTELSNVQHAWFFPNTANVSQPMEQEVTKFIKLS
jgi:hypothetical protein